MNERQITPFWKHSLIHTSAARLRDGLRSSSGVGLLAATNSYPFHLWLYVFSSYRQTLGNFSFYFSLSLSPLMCDHTCRRNSLCVYAAFHSVVFPLGKASVPVALFVCFILCFFFFNLPTSFSLRLFLRSSCCVPPCWGGGAKEKRKTQKGKGYCVKT
jgi:hypothetical protein